MLEFLIFTACLAGNGEGCGSATTAYYKQSGLEAFIGDKTKTCAADNPMLSTIVVMSAGAYQGMMTIPVAKDKSVVADMSKGMISLKIGF